jgi:hypothetical protein
LTFDGYNLFIVVSAVRTTVADRIFDDLLATPSLAYMSVNDQNVRPLEISSAASMPEQSSFGQLKFSNILNTVNVNPNSSLMAPHYVDENHRYVGGLDGVPVKYQKSCNYCRHRKIKCVTLPGESACNHCKQCEIQCIFSRKLPSKGRIMKSAQIAAKVDARSRLQMAEKLKVLDSNGLDSLATAAVNTEFLPSASDTPTSSVSSSNGCSDHATQVMPGVTAIVDQTIVDTKAIEVKPPLLTNTSSVPKSFDKSVETSKPQEKRLPQLIDPDPFLHIYLEPDSSVSIDSLSSLSSPPYDLYYNYVYPHTPFVSLYSFASKTDPDSVFKILLNIACASSPGNTAPSPNDLLETAKDQLALLLSPSYITDGATVGLLSSIMVHCKLSPDMEEALWRRYHDLPEAERTSEVAVGIAGVAAWYSLLHNTTDSTVAVKVPLSLCESISLDESQFSYHFVELSLLLYKFQILLASNSQEFCSPDESSSLASLSPSSSISGRSDSNSLKYQLLRLESALLLWPVKLPKDLTVVKDELLATSGAMILHILHNTVTIAFYLRAIKDKSLGRYLSIYPVPGLLQFLCGMATSSLKVGISVSKKWPIVRNYMHLTAEYILSLYEETEFQHCKVSLAFYEDRELDPLLYDRIQQVLGSQNWRASDFDGAIIYWVFRDARSMSLDAILKQNV